MLHEFIIYRGRCGHATGASIAAALTLILGLPTAYAISRGLIPKPFDSVIGGLLTSPLTIPPHTIVGLSLLILVSPISPPIPIIRRLPLVDTIWGLVAAYFIVSAPITIGAVRQVFDEVDPPVYEYVGLTLGSVNGASLRGSLYQ